jgi:hypothetical protein
LELYTSYHSKYTGKKIRVFKLGLNPIFRGGSYGITGDVCRIYNAYKVAILNEEVESPIVVPREMSAFLTEDWYTCPRCESGVV